MTEVQTYKVKRVNPFLLIVKLFLFSLVLGSGLAFFMLVIATLELNIQIPSLGNGITFAVCILGPFFFGAFFGLKANNSQTYIELEGNILRHYNSAGNLACTGDLTKVVNLKEHKTKFGKTLFIRFADNSLAVVGSGLENTKELTAKVREITNIEPSIITQDQFMVLVRELNARNLKQS